MKRLRAKEREDSANLRQTPTTGGQDDLPHGGGERSDDTPLSKEGAKFLKEFVSRTERAQGINITTTEIARFRLLGTIISGQGNDDDVLGVHDANLLYSARKQISFGFRELTGLGSAGLAHFNDENVPLWWWIDQTEAMRQGVLPLFSVHDFLPLDPPGFSG